MSKMAVVDPRLKWFVGRMRRKLALRKNQAKSDWRGLLLIENLNAIRDELVELGAVFNDPQPLNVTGEEIIDECADVANRAMMLADQIHALK